MARLARGLGKACYAAAARLFPFRRKLRTDNGSPKRVIAKALFLIVACVLSFRGWAYRERINGLVADTQIPLPQHEPDNRASYYLAAADLLKSGTSIDSFTDGCESIDRALADLARAGKTWDPESPALVEFVKANAQALQVFQEGWQAVQCRVPMLHFTSHPTVLPHTPQAEARFMQDLSRLRILARLILAESGRRLAAGDAVGAAQLARACLAMGYDFAPAGGLEQASVGVYSGGLGCRALAQAVTSAPLDDNALDIVERASRLEWQFRSRAGDPTDCCRAADWWSLLLAVRDPTREAILNATGLVYISHTPTYSSLAYLPESGDASRDVIAGNRTDEIRPDYQKDHYINAELRLIRAGTHVQRFVRRYGRFPETQGELAEASGEALPEHPITQEPVNLESQEDTLTLLFGPVRTPAFAGRKLTFRLARLKSNVPEPFRTAMRAAP